MWAEGYSNRLACLFVCLSVIRYSLKIQRFSYDAILQWLTILWILCGIVVKPFRFRVKAVRRRFRTVFGQSPYWNSLVLIDVCWPCKINFEPNFASQILLVSILNFFLISGNQSFNSLMEIHSFHMMWVLCSTCSIKLHNTIHSVSYL